MANHFLLMNLYALIIAAFFALLWRRQLRDRVKMFLQVYVGLVGGGLLVAWLMYPFPSGPPSPIP